MIWIEMKNPKLFSLKWIFVCLLNFWGELFTNSSWRTNAFCTNLSIWSDVKDPVWKNGNRIFRTVFIRLQSPEKKSEQVSEPRSCRNPERTDTWSRDSLSRLLAATVGSHMHSIFSWLQLVLSPPARWTSKSKTKFVVWTWSSWSRRRLCFFYCHMHRNSWTRQIQGQFVHLNSLNVDTTSSHVSFYCCESRKTKRAHVTIWLLALIKINQCVWKTVSTRWKLTEELNLVQTPETFVCRQTSSRATWNL